MRLKLFVAVAALLSASLAAHADTMVNYDVSLTTGTEDVSGTLNVDMTTGLISGAYIPVVLGGQTYILSTINANDQGSFGGSQDYQVEIDDPTYTADLELDLPVTSLAGYTGGPVCSADYTCTLLGSYFFYFVSNSHSGSESVVSGDIDQTPASVTPEPSSIALLGTGLLGIGGVMRKRFESSAHDHPFR